MCESLKPLFTEHQFGYLMAIKAPGFKEAETFAWHLFKTHYENDSIPKQIRNLQSNLQNAIDAARSGELNAIPEFAIDWPDNRDFMDGYIEGMLAMSTAFIELLEGVDKYKSTSDDSSVFEEVVLPWASHWQEMHKGYDLSFSQPVLSDEVYEHRILIVGKHRGLQIPSEGIHLGHWFDLVLFESNSASALISSLWAITPMSNGEGLEIEGRDERSGPISSERIFSTYSFEDICDEHWSAAKQRNDELLTERGFFTLQPMVENIARLLQVSPQEIAQDLGDIWDSQDQENGNALFMRPSREDVLAASFEESFFGLEPAAGFEIDPQNGQITVGSIGASWAGHSLIYHLENLELIDMDENLLNSLDNALWDALRKYGHAKKKCSKCQMLTAPFHLTEEGYCYGCGEKYFGAVY